MGVSFVRVPFLGWFERKPKKICQLQLSGLFGFVGFGVVVLLGFWGCWLFGFRGASFSSRGGPPFASATSRSKPTRLGSAAAELLAAASWPQIWGRSFLSN